MAGLNASTITYSRSAVATTSPATATDGGVLVTFAGNLAASDVPTLVTSGTGLTVAAVQQINFTNVSGATTGQFTLTGTNPLTGTTVSTSVAWAATAAGVLANIQAALDNKIFGTGNTIVTNPGGSISGPYIITFQGALASNAVATISLSNLGNLSGGAGGSTGSSVAGARARFRFSKMRRAVPQALLRT